MRGRPDMKSELDSDLSSSYWTGTAPAARFLILSQCPAYRAGGTRPDPVLRYLVTGNFPNTGRRSLINNLAALLIFIH